MKKIPTLFVRDLSTRLVTTFVTDGCEWVLAGEGHATVKFDGTCCLVRGGRLYKRRELKANEAPPPDFERVDYDGLTGKVVGWVPVGAGPDDKWHREAWEAIGMLPDNTYELMGPKVQGNTRDLSRHLFLGHDIPAGFLAGAPITYESLKLLLSDFSHEGVVWHHDDGRMAKIKRRDFGYDWPIKARL